MSVIITKKWNYYNDHDPAVAAWARELIRRGMVPPGEVDDRSILDVEPSDLRGFTQCHFFCGILGWSLALRLAGWPDDRPVWTGSAPCQPFSAAGLGRGAADERHLAPHWIELVDACRPPILFGEQVASSAVFGKAASGSRKRVAEAPEWAWLDDLCDRLETARYAVGASDLPAASVGAPHIRQRCFFGAVRLADSIGSGLEGQRRNGHGGGEPGRLGTDPAGPVAACCDTCWSDASHDPWRVADWLFCRDAKWRPVESSVLGVADGIPAELVRSGAFVPASSPLAPRQPGVSKDSPGARRVMRLRGYGNAIIPNLAAEFIKVFDDARHEVL